MDMMDYDEYATLKRILYEGDEWLKKVLEEQKQRNTYKNRWQTAIRDLILGR